MNEGQFAQVVCIVTKGDEPLTITWALHGQTVTSEAGLSTTKLGTRTSMLTIQSVGYRHSGEYTCTASNLAGSRSQSVVLKVNGNSSKKKRVEKARSCLVLFCCLNRLISFAIHRTTNNYAPNLWSRYFE